MCIAIAQPAGTRLLPHSLFKKCAQSNDDGLGLAWIDWRQSNPLKRLRILRISPDAKRNFDVDRFWERYRQIHHHWGAQSPIIIHFRMSTRGVVNQYNSHPFRVNPMTAMIHNGVLPLPQGPKHIIENLFFYEQLVDGYSDTWHYAHLYFYKFSQERFHSLKFIRNTEDFIGRGNKLVFLDATYYDAAAFKKGFENLIIYNEKEGVWDGKIWFSNHGYKEYSSCGNSSWRGYNYNRGGSTYGWLCQTKQCNNMVYTDGEDFCYTCRIAAERAAEQVADAAGSFSPVEYNKEKLDEQSDTRFYPPLVMKGEKDPKTNGEGGVLCAVQGCERVIPHRNQHYCSYHIQVRIDENKRRKAELKKQIAQKQEAPLNGNSK